MPLRPLGQGQTGQPRVSGEGGSGLEQVVGGGSGGLVVLCSGSSPTAELQALAEGRFALKGSPLYKESMTCLS